MMTPVIFRLTVLAACCGLLISTVYSLSRDNIRENQHAFAARQLEDVVGDPAATLVALSDQLYRAERDGALQGFVFETVTRKGYNGEIKLWLGINEDNEVTGVRVKSHQETPGIGDKVETSVSDWILSFNGKSLENPDVEDWKVKKDGGEFDQFTGATITARAVVSAVRQGLERAREQQRHWQVMDAVEEER